MWKKSGQLGAAPRISQPAAQAGGGMARGLITSSPDNNLNPALPGVNIGDIGSQGAVRVLGSKGRVPLPDMVIRGRRATEPKH